MTTLADTSLLELTQTILNSTVLLTKAQLQEKQNPPTANGHAEANGATNGVNGHNEVNGHGTNGVIKKQKTANQPSPQDLIDAKIKIVQAAADLTALVQGPANYLKSLSYGVRPTLSH